MRRSWTFGLVLATEADNVRTLPGSVGPQRAFWAGRRAALAWRASWLDPRGAKDKPVFDPQGAERSRRSPFDRLRLSGSRIPFLVSLPAGRQARRTTNGPPGYVSTLLVW